MSNYNILKIINKIQHLKDIDSNVYNYVFRKLYFKLLRSIYKFNKWHSGAIFEDRIYRKKILELIESIGSELSVVVELGCGLGEVLSRITAKKKYGVDLSLNVIKAARVINSKNITFIHGNFESIFDITESNISLLLLVNIFYAMPSQKIIDDIIAIIKKKNICYIISDKVYNPILFDQYSIEKCIGYKRVKVMKVLNDGENIRDLYLYRVINQNSPTHQIDN